MSIAVSSSPFLPRRRPSVASLWVYAPLLMALVLRVMPGGIGNVSYLLLAGYALLGRAHAIRALAMLWLFNMLGVPAPSAASVGRYAVLFAAAASALLYSEFLSKRPKLRPFTQATVFLGLFLIVHSLLFSPIVDVSALKALSWTLAMATLVSAWSGLSPGERLQVEHQLFWGLVLVLLVSLPMAALPFGYQRNGSGFQGILNHPQAFGPTMALLGAWAAARMFGEAKPGWWLLGLAGACVILVLMSQARTAGLAMVGGVALSILIAPSFAGRSIGRMVPGLRSKRLWTVIGAMLIVGVAFAPRIAETVGYYITKAGRVEASSFAEIYDRSRGRLMNAMLENIAEQPLTGIGFGIASEPWTMEVSRDPFLGLPTGASIEKGVTPLMVLEEVGIFGAMLVALWLFRLLRSGARSGLAPFAVCSTALLLNMGEATLFSPGGLGLLPMILLAWAYAGGTTGYYPRHG